jgi:spermidine/putrescine-binding protein
MTRARSWILFCLLLLFVHGMAGCAGVARPADPAAAETDPACPEPTPRLEVVSTEVNLFVWAQYLPQEIYDCFAEVYGIQVNLEEYSNDEEMVAKLSAGGANYDLVVPSDYILGLMIRRELLQPLDPARLHILEQFDPAFLDQPATATQSPPQRAPSRSLSTRRQSKRSPNPLRIFGTQTMQGALSCSTRRAP